MSSPAPPPSGFCHQCGGLLPPTALFCASCGTPRYGAGALFAPVGGRYASGGGPPPSPQRSFGPLGIVGIVVIVVVVLVAATILISFLLYIEVSGLAHGPSPTSIPLGTAFDIGSPQTTNCTGAWAAAGGCATLSDFAYQVPVLLSTVSLGDVGFSVTTSSGVVFHNSGVADIAAVANTGQVLAYSVIAPGAGISMVGGWVHYGGGFFPSTPLTSSDSIVIDMGQEQSTVGQSLVFQAIGLNGYSGIVSSQLP